MLDIAEAGESDLMMVAKLATRWVDEWVAATAVWKECHLEMPEDSLMAALKVASKAYSEVALKADN